MWRTIPGGVTAAKRFYAGGIAAGIKPSGKPDLVLIGSEVDAVAAGTFTRNAFRAACVNINEQRVREQATMRAIVVNAGNANAATGEEGIAAVYETAEIFARLLEISPEKILVASTGVIGVPLPMQKIRKHASRLVSEVSAEDGSEKAAEAILTTDLVEKTIALEGEIAGKTVRIGGIAKGSGMIHPNMATLLGFITADVAVEKSLWQELLSRAVEISFNQITVDGDTSTNDMILALANGAADNPLITDAQSPEANILEQMLTVVCIDLAKKVARDGEGATKIVEVQVIGAEDDPAARLVARTVAGSSLVKSAFFGMDPNWGRIAAAAGRAGVSFQVKDLAIWLGDFHLMERGEPLAFDREAASEYLRREEVVVRVSLGAGSGQGTAWGCDLSYDYVRINAEYTT
jgi:glutamate N-acetyltransferase / amino-acid N-acetyltransferase